MADQAAQKGTPVYDETEVYDSRHGRTTLNDEQKPSGLSEGSNKPSPEKTSFKVTQQG